MITVDTLNAINAALDAEGVADVKTKTSTRNQSKNTKLNERKEQRQCDPFSRIDIPLTKIDPEGTEHMALQKQIVYFYEVLGKIFGSQIRYDWKPKKHFLYWVTWMLLIFIVFSFMYTIIFHYNNGDYIRCLEPFAVFGIAFSCMSKWSFYLKRWPKIFSMVFFPRQLCLVNVGGIRAEVIKRGLGTTCTVLKMFTVGVVVLLLSYISVPAKFFFYDGIVIQIIPFEFVFVDQSTVTGLLFATVLQATLGVYAYLGTVMFGSAFLICICNYNFLVDLIKLDLTDLDEMWNGSSQTSVPFRYAYLQNICKKLQDMKGYLQMVRVIYETKFLVYFLAVYFSQAICLYEITEHGWILGYSVALMLFVEMMFYCLVGTQISIGDDKLCDMLYATNWHTYDLKSQRIIQMLLHVCQQPKQIELGTLGPLNVVTLVSIVKSIYSYYTVMSELL